MAELEAPQSSISTRSMTKKRRESGLPDGLVTPADDAETEDNVTATDEEDDGDEASVAVCTLPLL